MLKNFHKFRYFGKRFYHPGIAPFQQSHFVDRSDKIAISDNLGKHSYGDLQIKSDKISQVLSGILSNEPNSNIAYLTPNNHLYSVAQFGIWKSGFSCVPLCKSHPPDTLRYKF